jgi:hypothetical protein
MTRATRREALQAAPAREAHAQLADDPLFKK